MKQIPSLYEEKHRPQLHFSPPENWLNDPNGMFFYAGEYHLFYQYNPWDKVWGDIHWGHATSKDLLHWSHRPVALKSEPGRLGYIFSGSAVVDWHNSSGLQTGEHPPLVAMFTHSSKYDQQVQSIAYSLDGGDNWQMYANNPVIANPGIANWRDPKVIRDNRNNQWVMALAAGQKIMFYRSENLLDWSFLSEFGEDHGAHGGVWECPDLFPLRVPGSGEEKWVLMVSLNPGGPNGGSATQYFIGDFSGEVFRHDHAEIRWLDYGPDNYAGVTWSDVPESDGRRLCIAWMNNWNYANQLPTAPWRGAMTLPRELHLVETGYGLRLGARPVRELEQLRTGATELHEQVLVDNELHFGQGVPLAELLEIDMLVDWSDDKSDEWVLEFCNEDNEALLVDFKAGINELRVDRSRACLKMDTVDKFLKEVTAGVELAGQLHIGLKIIKDSSSLEIFTREGISLLTVQYFVNAPLDRMKLYSAHEHLSLVLKSASVTALKTVW